MDTLFCITIDDKELAKLKVVAEHHHTTTSNLIVERLTRISHVLEEAKTNNPYPNDIFTEMNSDDWKKVIEILQSSNISPDKVFGNWGRRVWNNCIDSVLREFQDES